MKFLFPAMLVALATTVGAQDTGDLPPCSIKCFEENAPKAGCEPTDQYCQCTSGREKITQLMPSCLIQACPDSKDQQKVLPAAAALCAKVVAANSSANSSASGSESSTPTVSPTAASTSSGAAVANGVQFGVGAIGFLAALLL